MSYSAYDPIIEASAKRPALWRLVLGLITVFVFLALWVFGLMALVALLRGQTVLRAFGTNVSLDNQTPEAAALFLALVWGLGIGTVVAAWVWHGRSWRTLTGQGSKTLHHFLVASIVAFGMISGLSLLVMPFSDLPRLNMDPTVWALFLPLGLVMIAGQTLSEELLFRGYIQSQLAARFGQPLIWMVVPSVLFGMAHYVPFLPPSAALVYVAIAALFGLMAADLTARTGSIGAAWGFHFANNTLAVLVVVSDGALTGLGLFKSKETLSDQMALSPLIAIDIAALCGIYLLIRRFVVR